MAGTYSGSKAELDSAASKTEEEKHGLTQRLTEMTGIREDLARDMQSEFAGKALQQQLGRAFDTGDALTKTLGQILDDLRILGTKVDASDQDGGASMNAFSQESGADATALQGSAAANQKLDVDWK